jgi:hypothetical protein
MRKHKRAGPQVSPSQSTVEKSKPSNTKPPSLRKIGGSGFAQHLVAQGAALLKPDGAAFGFLIATVIAASCGWTVSFYGLLNVPRQLWSWDNEVFSRGAIAVVAIALCSLAAIVLHNVLRRTHGVLIRLISDHILQIYCIALLILPIAYLLEDHGGYWGVFAMFCWAVLCIAWDCKKASAIQKPYLKTFWGKLRRFRRHRLIVERTSSRKAFARHKNLPLPDSFLAAVSPIYVFVVVTFYWGLILGLADISRKQYVIAFPDSPSHIAVARSGEYWLVKEATNRGGVLCFGQTTLMFKIDDSLHKSVRFTNKKYELQMVDDKRYKTDKARDPCLIYSPQLID